MLATLPLYVFMAGGIFPCEYLREGGMGGTGAWEAQGSTEGMGDTGRHWEAHGGTGGGT